jgi:NADH-quinone oxidoreductase subunit G
VLPALSFIEKGGSFMNIEGRIQTLRAGKAVPGGLYSDYEIFYELASRLGISLDIPKFATVKRETRSVNIKHVQNEREKRSSDLAATFAQVLFDRGVRMKHNPHLLQLTKEPFVRINALEGKKRNIREGQAIQLTANGRMITAKVKLDEKVAQGTVVVPLGFEQVPLHEWGANVLNGLEVSVSGS